MTRPATLTLFIPGIPSNTNRSGHMGSGKWQPVRERAEFRTKTAEIAKAEAEHAGWQAFPYTIIVAHHVSPVRRRRDPLGLAERLKAIMDGLVDAGLIPDDDEDHIEVQLAHSIKSNPAGIRLTLYGSEDL